MDERIEKIITVLYDNENALSDGFGYYCESVGATLREIAVEILAALDK